MTGMCYCSAYIFVWMRPTRAPTLTEETPPKTITIGAHKFTEPEQHRIYTRDSVCGRVSSIIYHIIII